MTDVPACWRWPLPNRMSVHGPWWAMLDWQDGRCAACGSQTGKMVTDHDHHTGLVRGLLCQGCNIREGYNSGRNLYWDRYRHVNPASVVGLEMMYDTGSECHLHAGAGFGALSCQVRANEIRERVYPFHFMYDADKAYSVKLDRDSQ